MSRVAFWASVFALLVGWSATPSEGQDLEVNPRADRRVELVAVYLGATSCGPCRTEETKQTVREVLIAAEQQAAARNLDFQSVGAAFDEEKAAGLELLEGTAEFDQVILGGSWSNAAAVEFIWSEAEVLAAIPQVVILTRTMDKNPQQREPATKHIFVQLQGETQMREWLDTGATVF